MSTSPTPPASLPPSTSPVELLLHHRPRIRRLAQRLAGRDRSADADDVEQDVYVAGLERPPRALVALPAWIGTTVRNLVSKRLRSKVRRDAREQSAATPEPLPPTDELVARVELEEFTLRCVRELAEPERTVVLLRFFEERSTTQIAQQLGLGESTVRARLQRAVERLRERLDARSDGDRDRWARAIAPWLFVTKSATPVASLALAAAVVLVAGGVATSVVVASGRTKGASVANDKSTNVAASRVDSTSGVRVSEPTRAAQTVVADAAIGSSPDASAAGPPTAANVVGGVQLRPVDALTRLPIADGSAHFADDDGCFFNSRGDAQHPEIKLGIGWDTQVGGHSGKWRMAVVAAGHDPEVRDLQIEGGKTLDLGDVPLRRGTSAIEGRVRRDATGDAGPRFVELRGIGRNPCPECSRHGEDGSCCGYFWDRSWVRIGADRRFEFRSLAAGIYWLRVLDDKPRAVPTVRVDLARGEAKLVDLDFATDVGLTLELVDDVGRPFHGQWTNCAEPIPSVFHFEFDVDGVTLDADVGPDPKELAALIGPPPPFDPTPQLDKTADQVTARKQREKGQDSGPAELFRVLVGSGSIEFKKSFNIGWQRQPSLVGVDDPLFQDESKVPGFAAVELAARRLDSNHWFFHDLPASRIVVRGGCASLKADDVELDLSKPEQRHARVVFRPVSTTTSPATAGH